MNNNNNSNQQCYQNLYISDYYSLPTTTGSNNTNSTISNQDQHQNQIQYNYKDGIIRYKEFLHFVLLQYWSHQQQQLTTTGSNTNNKRLYITVSNNNNSTDSGTNAFDDGCSSTSSTTSDNNSSTNSVESRTTMNDEKYFYNYYTNFSSNETKLHVLFDHFACTICYHQQKQDKNNIMTDCNCAINNVLTTTNTTATSRNNNNNNNIFAFADNNNNDTPTSRAITTNSMESNANNSSKNNIMTSNNDIHISSSTSSSSPLPISSYNPNTGTTTSTTIDPIVANTLCNGLNQYFSTTGITIIAIDSTIGMIINNDTYYKFQQQLYQNHSRHCNTTTNTTTSSNNVTGDNINDNTFTGSSNNNTTGTSTTPTTETSTSTSTGTTRNGIFDYYENLTIVQVLVFVLIIVITVCILIVVCFYYRLWKQQKKERHRRQQQIQIGQYGQNGQNGQINGRNDTKRKYNYTNNDKNKNSSSPIRTIVTMKMPSRFSPPCNYSTGSPFDIISYWKKSIHPIEASELNNSSNNNADIERCDNLPITAVDLDEQQQQDDSVLSSISSCHKKNKWLSSSNSIIKEKEISDAELHVYTNDEDIFRYSSQHNFVLSPNHSIISINKSASSEDSYSIIRHASTGSTEKIHNSANNYAITNNDTSTTNTIHHTAQAGAGSNKPFITNDHHPIIPNDSTATPLTDTSQTVSFYPPIGSANIDFTTIHNSDVRTINKENNVAYEFNTTDYMSDELQFTALKSSSSSSPYVIKLNNINDKISHPAVSMNNTDINNAKLLDYDTTTTEKSIRSRASTGTTDSVTTSTVTLPKRGLVRRIVHVNNNTTISSSSGTDSIEYHRKHPNGTFNNQQEQQPQVYRRLPRRRRRKMMAKNKKSYSNVKTTAVEFNDYEQIDSQQQNHHHTGVAMSRCVDLTNDSNHSSSHSEGIHDPRWIDVSTNDDDDDNVTTDNENGIDESRSGSIGSKNYSMKGGVTTGNNKSAETCSSTTIQQLVDGNNKIDDADNYINSINSTRMTNCDDSTTRSKSTRHENMLLSSSSSSSSSSHYRHSKHRNWTTSDDDSDYNQSTSSSTGSNTNLV